jgi:hypothetical protein
MVRLSGTVIADAAATLAFNREISHRPGTTMRFFQSVHDKEPIR